MPSTLKRSGTHHRPSMPTRPERDAREYKAQGHALRLIVIAGSQQLPNSLWVASAPAYGAASCALTLHCPPARTCLFRSRQRRKAPSRLTLHRRTAEPDRSGGADQRDCAVHVLAIAIRRTAEPDRSGGADQRDCAVHVLAIVMLADFAPWQSISKSARRPLRSSWGLL
jgi:hypothetical protein